MQSIQNPAAGSVRLQVQSAFHSKELSQQQRSVSRTAAKYGVSLPKSSFVKNLVLQYEDRVRVTSSVERQPLFVRASTDCPERNDGLNGDGVNGDNLKVPSSMSFGSFGGATMERSGLDLTQKEEVATPKIDDGQGGGGNGKNISNGGGGDGDDDDDEWMDDEGDDEEGDDGIFAKRTVLPELFDRATIECVLQEWFRTMADLPTGLRMAVEMGLVSSAQLVRFMSMDVRPTVTRFVSRVLPEEQSRAFVGRLMADPSFILKMVMEQGIAIAGAVHYEAQQRGKNLKNEWDLAAVNVLTVAASHAAIVWALSPSRSFGAAQKFKFQRIMHSLPHNIFDKSGPMRQYTNATRAAGMVVGGLQLAVVGAVIGAVSSTTQSALQLSRQYKAGSTESELSVPVPEFGQAAGAYSAHMGASSAIRYQFLAGAERYIFNNFGNIQLCLTTSFLARAINYAVGDTARLTWLGLPTTAPIREPEPEPIVVKTVDIPSTDQATAAGAAAAAAAATGVAAAAASKQSFSMSAGLKGEENLDEEEKPKKKKKKSKKAKKAKEEAEAASEENLVAA